MKHKYRIVSDNYSGYECQKKRWWFPVWLQMNHTNTHLTLEDAKGYIERDAKVLAEYIAD